MTRKTETRTTGPRFGNVARNCAIAAAVVVAASCGSDASPQDSVDTGPATDAVESVTTPDTAEPQEVTTTTAAQEADSTTIVATDDDVEISTTDEAVEVATTGADGDNEGTPDDDGINDDDPLQPDDECDGCPVSWEPPPDVNDPMSVSVTAPDAARVGSTITVSAVANDDAEVRRVFITTDGPTVERYTDLGEEAQPTCGQGGDWPEGPTPPPEKDADSRRTETTFTFTAAGTYLVSASASSERTLYCWAGEPQHPYGSTGTNSTVIEVLEAE